MLEARESVTAENVAGVLPDAVARASDANRTSLAISLEPSVTTALGTVARREADLLGEILAPTIGASVRKAVADAMAVLLARFNEALERSVSIEGIRWRIEARRTGRPFSEVVMLRTLRYRVEQVFLVHAATSLVLEHVADPALNPQSPDQVAAMLAAIDAFGREALGPLPSGSHLERFQYGELTVCVTQDAWLTVAAVVRGAPPPDISAHVREVHERVRLAFQKELDAFAGDATPFARARDELLPLLRAERRPPSRRGQVLLLVAAIVAGAVIMVLVGRSIVRARAERRLENAYVEAFASEPGIVLTSTRVREGRPRLVGLRDPLAAPPDEVATRHGLPPLAPGDLELAPFVSLDPALRLRRIERALAPPPTVALVVDGAVLHLVGTAPRAWIERAAVFAPLMPGIEREDDRDLRSDESLAALQDARSELARIEIPFARGSSEIPPAREVDLQRAADRAGAVLRRAADAGLDACIAVDAHADATGTDERNRSIRADRAAAVMDALAARGIPRDRLHARRAAGVDPEPSRAAVTFRADLGCEESP